MSRFLSRPSAASASDLPYRFVNLIGRAVLRLLGIRFDLQGAEHLPRRGAVIIASNHVSFPDFVFLERLAVTRGRYVRFLCRHDMWAGGRGFVGFWMDLMRHVPVDRASGAPAYLRARRLLRAGEAVGIFPEAGVSPAYTVRWMMRGAVALARDTGAPIVPAAVWGGQRIFTAGQTRPDLTRGRPVSVVYGEPVHVAPDADLRAATEDLGRRLTELLEGLQSQAQHRPRPGEQAPWYPAHLGGQALSPEYAATLVPAPSSAVTPVWGPSASTG